MPAHIRTRVRGLKALDRALGKADKSLRKNLRIKLRDIAWGVVTEARGIAESKGLRESGDLIRGIRPFTRTGSAGVRSTATHGGYEYPRRLEFEHGAGSHVGPRATLFPAVEAQDTAIERASADLLDDIADDFARG